MAAAGIRHPYFLGIGGIGMSALALHYLQQKCKVDGYDRVRTPLTRKLEAAGAVIHYTEDPDAIPADTDCVIYTPAIPATHAEWAEIRRRALPVYKRAEILGMLSRQYKTLAVAGTHGKTTTSALLAYLLNGSIGCNAILGGLSPDLGGNYLYNARSGFLVTEADEYDRSFLQLHPYFSAVTAWDADHLDIYGNLENMRSAYVQFMRQSEHFIAEASMELPLEPDYFYSAGTSAGTSAFSDALPPERRAFASKIRIEDGACLFTYTGPKGCLENLCLHCPGRHNVENAVAAISMALEVGVPAGAIRELLPGFRGVSRRLELKYRSENLIYFDDYAHHPAEITASIAALREFFPKYEMCVFFQPHLYSRTRDLAVGFAVSLEAADALCLVDIYPARELPISGVDTRLIGDRIAKIPVSYVGKPEVGDRVEALVREGEASGKKLLIVTMGAGDIDTWVGPIADMLEKGGRS